MGRTYLYGLGAAGEAGVERALAMLTDELRRAMQLCGVRSLAETGPDLVEELR
jgi:isopentenyl diphosphate isomerase/L-lactate dehydrogenase-like FMN-dependent dehydrogenase